MKPLDTYSWMDNHVNRMLDGEAVATLPLPSSRFPDEPRSGQWIRFRIGDIYVPNLTDLYQQMTPELELEGYITLLSDGNGTQAAYALVEVPGILLPLIVPTACLEVVADERVAVFCE